MISFTFTPLPISPEFREPFKRFYLLFRQTFGQLQHDSNQLFVLLVLAKGALAQGIVPEVYLNPFKKALTRRDSAALLMLLGKMKDYYGYPTL